MDEGADGVGVGTDLVSVVHINIETFFSLPINPFLNGRFEGTVGDDQHLDRVLPEVRMIAVDVAKLSFVEHRFVDARPIRVESTGKLFVSGVLVILAEVHFHLDVIVNTDEVVDGIILHGIDGQSTNLDATHGALNIEHGNRTLHKTSGGVCLGVIVKRNVLRVLVLEKRSLLRIEAVNAVVGKVVNSGGVILHLDTDVANANRHSNQFVGCRHSRITDVSCRIRAVHRDVGEHAFFGGDFSSIDAAE